MPAALTEIRYASCSLTDKDALASLFAPIRGARGANLAKFLRETSGGELWSWHDEGKAFYVATDGAFACLATVTEVSQAGAAKILAECRSMSAWGESQFTAAVVRALDATAITLQ
jgi:hypothetical protein